MSSKRRRDEVKLAKAILDKNSHKCKVLGECASFLKASARVSNIECANFYYQGASL